MSLDLPWLERQAIGPSQRAELLDVTSWSRDFEWKEIQLLAEQTEAYFAPKGIPIFREGDVVPYLAVILQGRVAVVKTSSEGDEKVLAELGPDKALGEMSLIDSEPRSATAIARTDTLLLLLGRPQFTFLAENHPRVAFKLMLRVSRMLSQRLRRTSGQLIEYLE